MPLTRASNTTTKRGKQFMRAIEQSRARYEGLPERVQTSMNRVLASAARELDIQYQNMPHDEKMSLGQSRYFTQQPALGLKRTEK